MIIAQKKRKENIVEYLLYIWYVEDLIRANGFDSDKIKHTIVDAYKQTEEAKADIAKWYENLTEAMISQGIKEKGHLEANNNIVAELSELHNRLMKSPEQTLYHSAYFKTLPLIVQLRAKAGKNPLPEIETCLSALYGYSILKLKNNTISDPTAEGMKQIALYLSILAERYKENNAQA